MLVRRYGTTTIGEVKQLDRERVVGIVLKNGKPFCWKRNRVEILNYDPRRPREARS